ncbi:MAG TPA: hypothetical protein V6D17_25290 [Candidatus Obscuribacterales bacterium]
MAIVDGALFPWERQGLSKFDWGVKKRQKRASERFARGGTHEEKFGESEERYWQKRCFIELVCERAQEFLRLKVHNSVRILFKLSLEGDLADTYPLPSPAIVRARLVRIENKGDQMRCEWRAADAVGEMSCANDSFDAISSCFCGPQHNRIITFLESHFGVDVQPHIHHFPEVTSVEARMVLREPLGALAVMEGDSRKISHDGNRHVIDSTRCVTYKLDDSALMEA